MSASWLPPWRPPSVAPPRPARRATVRWPRVPARRPHRLQAVGFLGCLNEPWSYSFGLGGLGHVGLDRRVEHVYLQNGAGIGRRPPHDLNAVGLCLGDQGFFLALNLKTRSIKLCQPLG